jgi:hypothetical protein
MQVPFALSPAPAAAASVGESVIGAAALSERASPYGPPGMVSTPTPGTSTQGLPRPKPALTDSGVASLVDHMSPQISAAASVETDAALAPTRMPGTPSDAAKTGAGPHPSQRPQAQASPMGATPPQRKAPKIAAYAKIVGPKIKKVKNPARRTALATRQALRAARPHPRPARQAPFLTRTGCGERQPRHRPDAARVKVLVETTLVTLGRNVAKGADTKKRKAPGDDARDDAPLPVGGAARADPHLHRLASVLEMQRPVRMTQAMQSGGE